MNISVYGVGYVGLVTAVCFACRGHQVSCYDIDEQKIQPLQAGRVPICEEGLEVLLQQVLAQDSIRFTTVFQGAVAYSRLHIVAVGMPSDINGSVNLSFVDLITTRLALACAQTNEYQLIVNKSTVPVGTAAYMAERLGRECDVVSNPESLREGQATADFMHPERIIIGSDSERASAMMRTLYAPWIDQEIPILLMNPPFC